MQDKSCKINRVRRFSPPRWGRLVLLGIALFFHGCSPKAPSPGDVVFVTIDTLRGDCWGCLGDPRGRTPFLDRLSRASTLAFEGRAPAPVTLPSHVSIMTGLPPAIHGVRDNGIFQLSATGGRTLAERLREAGFATAAFVGAFPLASRFGLDRGFDHYDDFLRGEGRGELGGFRERSAGSTIDRLEQYLTGAKAPPLSTPLFLWVHFFDPHAEYEPPRPWGELAGPYRGEVAYVDGEIGRLLRTVGRSRPLPPRLVAVLSDHGEGLGEHGESTHGALLQLSTIRVPLLLREPSGLPRLVARPIAVESVPATILAKLGIDWRLNPESAAPLEGPGASEASPAVHAETLYPYFNFGWSGLRSREEGTWRLVTGAVDRLYQLAVDPGETRDVASQHPEIVARLKRALQEEWAARERAALPSATGSLSAEELETLQSLGYAAQSALPGQVAFEGAFDGELDPNERVGLLDRINAGITYLRLGQATRAVEVLRSAIEEGGKNRLTLEYLGRAHAASGENREAREAFLEALELGPSPESVYLDLAAAERALGNSDAEWIALRRALDIYPESVSARQGMCQILVEQGRVEEALTLLREAVAIRPRSASSHLNLAQAYEALGDRANAETHYRKVVELEGSGASGERARAALARLGSEGSKK
jgi:arylsulfatase A-like enzyme/Flp pilus assembly protein TadD